MGVNGLWTVVQPCARPTNLATLNRKRLAVDASIWIYQFLKAVRDKEGNALRNSHVVGFFRRICKLLWFGIRPVFVFDGGAPVLKRATLQGRRRRREGRREDAARTAGKLLAVQMQRLAEGEAEKRRERRRVEEEAGRGRGLSEQAPEEERERLPDMESIVYADELGMSKQEREKSRKFHKQDAYHLPELGTGGIAAMGGRADDPRIMSIEELEEYARQFNAGEDVNLYDFSKIDFDGDFFRSLPPADRYNILNAARIRSRLRMGLSKDQLDDMFPDRMAFSRFQIERVRERNHLTQRLMYELGMTGTDWTVGVNARIAGDKDREYILVKNEGAEGGWALGVVSRADRDQGKMNNPIDVDALDFQFQEKDENMEEDDDDDDDDDFEDVPIEGLNRLPRLQGQPGFAAYERARELGSARQRLYDSRLNQDDEDADDALFVNDGEPNQEELFGADDEAMVDEEEDLNRAIAMSLESQHGIGQTTGAQSHDAADKEADEDLPAPEWTQKAVDPARPIVGSSSGKMIAHIVNNRANAAVPKPQDTHDDDSESDDEMDLQAALRAARKKPEQSARPPRPVAPSKRGMANPFGGPLPFEKLDWKFPALAQASMFGAAAVEKPEAAGVVEVGALEPESDEEAGGFEKEVAPVGGGDREEEGRDNALSIRERVDAPRPLPPWLADDNDIRESVQRQKELDDVMNAEDERAREEIQRRKRDEVIEIHSSDGSESDVEIIEPPLPPPPRRVPAPELGASLPSMDDVAPESTGHSSIAQQEASAQPGFEVQMSPRHPVQSSSPEDSGGEEFEDVALPVDMHEPESVDVTDLVDDGDAQLDALLFDGGQQPPPPARTLGPASTSDQSDDDDDGLLAVDDPDASAPEEFEDGLSEAEDGELLAQLALEAEEHARFASELNPATSRGGAQAAYEDELKQLRTQQRKDRRDADEVTQVMVAECQALLRLFGIPYMTAPMEAEAQCAELVALGLVDGIVTDDSDIFLFGGTRVFKNMFNGNKLVECYLGADLERELSLGRAELIALAQLLGSDYAEGLPGVGPVTAVEILSEFPGGQQGLAEFASWWRAAQQSQVDPAAAAADPRAELTVFRRKFRKSQAARLFLPPGFPSLAVADAYLKPEVDHSPEAFQWGVPDLEGLRQFLMATIGWSQERTDEVLVPVIRDMNRREAEGTQSNITRYFEGSVGVGSRAPQQKGGAGAQKKGRGRAGAGGSKRMTDAVSRLKANAGRGPGGLSTELVVSMPVDAEEGGRGRKGRAEKTRALGKRKRKARGNVVDDDEEEDGMDEAEAVAIDDGEEEDEGEDGDEGRDDGSDTESGNGEQARNRGKATRRTGKKRAKT